MLKKSKLLFVATLFCSLSACGGDSGAPAPAPAPGPAIGTAGIFDVNYGQFTGVYTLLDDGRFYGMHFVGSVLAGHPHGPLSSTNSTTSREPIAWANFIDDAGQVGAQEQAGVFGRSFHTSSLDVSITGSMGSFRATTTHQKPWSSTDAHKLYTDAIPMATIAGTYAGIVRTAGISTPAQAAGTFTIAPDGAVTTTAVGCSFAGTIVAHGSTGVFDAHLVPSGAGCHFSGALDGIVTPLSFDGSLPKLGFQLDTADNLQTAVFVVTKQ